MFNLSILNHKFATTCDVNMWRKNLKIKDIFAKTLINLRNLNRYEIQTVYDIMKDTKRNDLRKITTLLLLIIPEEYFGNNKNILQFARLCKRIMTRSRFECIYEQQLSMNFDLTVIDWLADVKNKKLALNEANKWLLNKVFKPLIRSCFKTVIYNYQIKLVKRSCWQSYQQIVVNKLLADGTMKKVFNVPRYKIKGNLVILPKGDLCDLNFKTRTRFVNRHDKANLKNVSHRIFKYARTITRYKPKVLSKYWPEFIWNKQNKEIFAAKIDLLNAYGNVDTEFVLEHMRKANKFWITDKVLNTVNEFIKEQYVQVSGKRLERSLGSAYLWQKGVVKGHPLSASICELYLVLKDNDLGINSDPENCLFIRNVDDYLYCSTKSTDVRKFIDNLTSSRIVNEAKTETNIDQNKVDNITYFGRSIQVSSKEISNSYSFESRYEIRYRFKFMSYKRVLEPKALLRGCMAYKVNSFHFNQVTLNLNYNKRETFYKNFYDATIYLAFKFGEAYYCVRDTNIDVTIVTDIIIETVQTYAKIAMRLSKKHTRDVRSTAALKLLVFIGYEAFTKVFCKRYNFRFYYDPVILPQWLTYCKGIPKKFEAIRRGRSLRNALVLQ